jgi:hypothetical protein
MDREDVSRIPVNSFLGAFQCLRKQVREARLATARSAAGVNPFAETTTTEATSLERPCPGTGPSESFLRNESPGERMLRVDLERLLRDRGLWSNSTAEEANSFRICVKRWRRPSALALTRNTNRSEECPSGTEVAASSSYYGLCPASVYIEELNTLWTVWRRTATAGPSAEQWQRLALSDLLWSHLLTLDSAIFSARALQARIDMERNDDNDLRSWRKDHMLQTAGNHMEAAEPTASLEPPESPSGQCTSEDKRIDAGPLRAPSEGKGPTQNQRGSGRLLAEQALMDCVDEGQPFSLQNPPTRNARGDLLASNISKTAFGEHDTSTVLRESGNKWSASTTEQQIPRDSLIVEREERTQELIVYVPPSNPQWGVSWIPGAYLLQPLILVLETPSNSGAAVAATLEVLSSLLQHGAARGLVLDEHRDVLVLPSTIQETDQALSVSFALVDQLALIGRRWLDDYARSRVLPQLVNNLARWYQERNQISTHEGAMLNFVTLLETIVRVGHHSADPADTSKLPVPERPGLGDSKDIELAGALPVATFQSILMLCLHIALGQSRHRSLYLRRRAEDAFLTLTRLLFQQPASVEIREWILRLIAAMIDPGIADIAAAVAAEKAEEAATSQRPLSSTLTETHHELRHALWGNKAGGRPATEWISLGLLSSASEVARRRHETQMFGLRILEIVLEAISTGGPTPSQNVLVNCPVLRAVALGPMSIAMLRCCTLSSETHATEVLTRALPLSLRLVQCLDRYAFTFLQALLTTIVPSHLSMHDEANHRATGLFHQELALQLLRRLVSRLDLLWAAYLAYDCSLQFVDVVEPLFNVLATSRHPFALHVIGTLLETLQQPNFGSYPLVLPTETTDWDRLRRQKEQKRYRREVLRSMALLWSKERECTAPDLWNYLEKHLPSSPVERRDTVFTLAHFLRYTPELDKTIIGQVIGSPDPFSQQVLAAYAATFDLHNLSIDIALRLFLESFRLPGESQKIDRIMQAFANHYFTQNQGPALPLISSDAAHVLSFAIIMLNTDQHHDQVKHRMTLAEFINNNRGLNDGKDLPPDYLRGIYERIRQSEIRLTDDHGVAALDAVHWDAQLRTQEALEWPQAGSCALLKDHRQVAQTLLQLLWPSVLGGCGARLSALTLPFGENHELRNGSDRTAGQNHASTRPVDNGRGHLEDLDLAEDDEAHDPDDIDDINEYHDEPSAVERWRTRLERWKATTVDGCGTWPCRFRTKTDLFRAILRLFCRLGWTAHVLGVQAVLSSVLETLIMLTGLLDDRWPVATTVRAKSARRMPPLSQEDDLAWQIMSRWPRAPLSLRSCTWLGRHRRALLLVVTVVGLASRCVSSLNEVAWCALIALHLRLVEMRLLSPLRICPPATGSMPSICLPDGTELLTGGLAPRWACILRDQMVEQRPDTLPSRTSTASLIGYRGTWAMRLHTREQESALRSSSSEGGGSPALQPRLESPIREQVEAPRATNAIQSPKDFSSASCDERTHRAEASTPTGVNEEDVPTREPHAPPNQNSGGGLLAAFLTGIGLGLGGAQRQGPAANSSKENESVGLSALERSLHRSGSLRDLERTLSDPEDDNYDDDDDDFLHSPAAHRADDDEKELSNAECGAQVPPRESESRRRHGMEDSWDLVRAVLPRYLLKTNEDAEARLFVRYCLVYSMGEANLLDPSRWGAASTALLKALERAAQWAFGLDQTSRGEAPDAPAVTATAAADDAPAERWFHRRALRRRSRQAFRYATWRRAWLLEHISLVVLSDPTRAQHHWRLVHNLVHMELATLVDRPLLSLECAVFALLRLATGYLWFANLPLHTQGGRDEEPFIEAVFRDLRLLIPLPTSTFSAISLPVLAGLYVMLDRHPSCIPFEDGWQTVCILLEHGIRLAEPCAQVAWQGLTRLVQILEHFQETSLFQRPDAALDEVLLQCLEALLTVMEQSNLHRARAAAALIDPLFRRALEHSKELPAPEHWLPVVDRLVRLTSSHESFLIRHEALAVLDRILMEPLWQTLSDVQRTNLFTGLLLPLAETLQQGIFDGTLQTDDPRLLERFLIRLVMLTNRNWLLHHALWRDVAPAALSDWWMRLIGVLGGLYTVAIQRSPRFADSPLLLSGRRATKTTSLVGSETLAEHIHETLKNTLLVMVASGFLSPSTETWSESSSPKTAEQVQASRWANTFAQLAPVFPDLEEELLGLIAAARVRPTPVRSAGPDPNATSETHQEMSSQRGSETAIPVAVEELPATSGAKVMPCSRDCPAETSLATEPKPESLSPG